MSHTKERDEAVSRAVEEIEKYLDAHPGAADTLHGIGHSWLPEDGRFAAEVLHQAVERLVAKGRVDAHVVPGGTRVYRDRPRATS